MIVSDQGWKKEFNVLKSGWSFCQCSNQYFPLNCCIKKKKHNKRSLMCLGKNFAVVKWYVCVAKHKVVRARWQFFFQILQQMFEEENVWGLWWWSHVKIQESIGKKCWYNMYQKRLSHNSACCRHIRNRANKEGTVLFPSQNKSSAGWNKNSPTNFMLLFSSIQCFIFCEVPIVNALAFWYSSKNFFKKIWVQCFYKAWSHNSFRRRKYYPQAPWTSRGRYYPSPAVLVLREVSGKKFEILLSKESNRAGNESLSLTPYLFTLQRPIANATTFSLPIVLHCSSIPYPNTLSSYLNTLPILIRLLGSLSYYIESALILS